MEISVQIPVGHYFSADGSTVLMLDFITKLCTKHLDFLHRVVSLFMHPSSQGFQHFIIFGETMA